MTDLRLHVTYCRAQFAETEIIHLEGKICIQSSNPVVLLLVHIRTISKIHEHIITHQPLPDTVLKH